MYISIPTFDADNKAWTRTEFSTNQQFVDFLWTLWSEPGKYNFNEDIFYFNEKARFYSTNKFYCAAIEDSIDYIKFWETEKDKCKNGMILKTNGKYFHVSRDYYFLLNFLPIYNKEKKKFTFPDIRDAQYHMDLYEALAEHSYKHVAVLKKRQIMSSYFHAAKLINRYWFEDGAVLKIAASLKDYINDKGTWKYLDEYKNFLNEHTGWYRACNPDKPLAWQQKLEKTVKGKKFDVGNKSTITGFPLDKNPAQGVGGPCTLFFHEEAGIASRMNITIEFLLPALKSGHIYTGMFIAAGSVGDLKECEPLRQMIMYPDSKDVLAVETNLLDDKGTIGKCGLFIPEQWSMPPFIDKYGNSKVEEALKALLEEREELARNKKPEDLQLHISQHPINIKEAFANRTISRFPMNHVTQQRRRIEDGNYFIENVELQRQKDNSITFQPSHKLPIREFPIGMGTKDKEGVIEIHEHPIDDAPFGLYYGSIDPVRDGKTSSSSSLCSIYIYKTSHEVSKIGKDNRKETYIEKGKLVAWWCGRYDDVNKTHELLSMLIEYYNARTLVENNVSGFITYMIGKKRQRYLIMKSEMLFLQDMKANTMVYQDYGWRNTGTMFDVNLIDYAIKFIEEELDTMEDEEGNIIDVTYGVERIPDIMLLEEMSMYRKGLNVDRLISFSALCAFIAIQEANRGPVRVTQKENNDLQKSDKLGKLIENTTNRLQQSVYKVSRSAFRHLGKR